MIFKPKYHLEMIDPSSKISLKMSCLRACENNVAQARELYEFLAADIGDLPDVEPIKPGALEQVKQGATEVFSWISQHRDDIAQGVSFIKSLRQTTMPTPGTTIPPIPKI